MAPHSSEELWRLLGNSESLVDSKWLEYDEKFLKSDEINIQTEYGYTALHFLSSKRYEDFNWRLFLDRS